MAATAAEKTLPRSGNCEPPARSRITVSERDNEYAKLDDGSDAYGPRQTVGSP
jgi:hypothetical protein